MDVSFPLDKARRKKYRKKQNANKSRKGINNLPDPILQHTLSYLSTKEAVRTSILMPCLFTWIIRSIDTSHVPLSQAPFKY